MITSSNFTEVLANIGFQKSNIGNFYTRDFDQCQMSVDVDNAKLLYPEDKGLIVNDKTTSNFAHPENFVVFECVCRLLAKGYRPEHIELEPRWQLGRAGKSGKADIVVRDADGACLIIIECKTSGVEYNRELKNTEEYGGQLFSYWQQENATRWLALYASDWKDGEVKVHSQVISCTDDTNILRMAATDKDLLTYRNAKNDAERHEVWKETYGSAWLDNVIFADESLAYEIGVPPLRKGKLRDFTPEDKIVNRFEEILRHNNVSDKENAFNRLVALFICKLVDEIKKQDFEEVDFQYKPGSDDYETLQDRLQRLHQQGMEEFMRERIFYVAADYAERLFQQYTGSRRKAAIEDLRNTIRILKFYSNNDFAFKDVHNEELFFQNGKILVEVVQLFQPYRIVYPSKHQFLGDLFEQLLSKGFKQNEGQFFTPTPITRFIWDALPLQSYISEHGLPNVIDYACGAGHFLTEAVEAINEVRHDANNQWVEKHIYGVEKDYRLARVSKISMFMNGAGGANIIFGDGLENYADKHIEPFSFDILVANPPYSVKGFKQHLKLRNNTFRLLGQLTNDAKEIETLFVERVAQLLRPQGIAAVVLPASILTNGDCYTAAREELLQNFHLRAVVCFGSKTFGATGTNTVTLFLQRYNEPPRLASITRDSVSAIMSGDELTDWTDRQLFEAYTSRQGVAADTYRKFLAKGLELQEVEKDGYLRIYTDAFSATTAAYPKRATQEERDALRRAKFYEFALGVEREKLYYFALAMPQTTVVITAPTDNKDQKAFLGYDWSNRKGSEGIVIDTPGGKLYDAADRFARGTLACAVRNSFMGARTTLPDEVAEFAATCRLADLMDFSRAAFDKAISTSERKESAQISSKWPMVRLGDVAEVVGGLWKGKKAPLIKAKVIRNTNFDMLGNLHVDDREVAELEVEESQFKKRQLLKGDIIVEKSGGSESQAVGRVVFFDKDESNYTFSNFTNRLRISSERIISKYVFLYLNYVYQMGGTKHMQSGMSGLKNLSVPSYMLQFIPHPPLPVQRQIVTECEKVDEEYNTSRATVATYRQKIADTLKTKGKGPMVRLESLLVDIIGSTNKVAQNKIQTSGKYPVVTQEDSNLIAGYCDNENCITDIPVIVFGDHSCTFKYIDFPFHRGADGTQLIKIDQAQAVLKYVYYVLPTLSIANVGKYERHFKYLKLASFPLPSLNVQHQLISEIESYESVISRARSLMESCAARKRSILEKHLQ